MYHDRVFFPQGVNMYVPAMSGSADLQLNTPQVFDLGKPALSLSGNVMAAASVNMQAANGTEVLQTLNWVSDAPYGRQIGVLVSGVPGGAGTTVRLLGWDYLGQPVAEDVTVGAAVATVVYTDKAFYRLAKTRIIATATNAVTAQVGTGPKLGLPYKSFLSWIKEDGVVLYRFEVTAGKLVNADTTDPATATSTGAQWCQDGCSWAIPRSSGKCCGEWWATRYQAVLRLRSDLWSSQPHRQMRGLLWISPPLQQPYL
jgi:hypothetical protein